MFASTTGFTKQQMLSFKIQIRTRANPRQVLRQIGGHSNNTQVRQTCVHILSGRKARARAHTHTRARTHAHTHTHTYNARHERCSLKWLKFVLTLFLKRAVMDENKAWWVSHVHSYNLAFFLSSFPSFHFSFHPSLLPLLISSLLSSLQFFDLNFFLPFIISSLLQFNCLRASLVPYITPGSPSSFISHL